MVYGMGEPPETSIIGVIGVLKNWPTTRILNGYKSEVEGSGMGWL